MADPLTLREIRTRLENLSEYELDELLRWLSSYPFEGPVVLPQLPAVDTAIREEQRRRQGLQKAPEGGYSQAIRDMYGL